MSSKHLNSSSIRADFDSGHYQSGPSGPGQVIKKDTPPSVGGDLSMGIDPDKSRVCASPYNRWHLVSRLWAICWHDQRVQKIARRCRDVSGEKKKIARGDNDARKKRGEKERAPIESEGAIERARYLRGFKFRVSMYTLLLKGSVIIREIKLLARKTLPGETALTYREDYLFIRHRVRMAVINFHWNSGIAKNRRGTYRVGVYFTTKISKRD